MYFFVDYIHFNNMKKTLILLCLSSILLAACSAKVVKNMDVDNLKEKVESHLSDQDFSPILEDLTVDERSPSVVENTDGTKTHKVIVKQNGAFLPSKLEIEKGDTVEWDFFHRTDAIASVSEPGVCDSYEEYNDDEAFVGPMPRLVSGVFITGSHEEGLIEENANDADAFCPHDKVNVKTGDLHICKIGDKHETMAQTWQNSDLTGVYIRIDWHEVHKAPGVFDWTILDREVERAVESGKVYSLSLRSGKHGEPDWISDESVVGAANVVKEYHFVDGGDSLEPGQCGSQLYLASPTDPNYQKYYFEVLEAAADHLKEKNAWYRNLAYIKPSGANMFTHENRVPKRCEPGCLCNPEVWVEAGYTPSGIYDFYSKQTELLAEAFPEKDMSYMLIQGGFPKVGENGEYEGQDGVDEDDLPRGVEQTEKIIKQGIEEHGTRFVVQHNGLREKPQDGFNYNTAACPNEGQHPIKKPYGAVGSGCPNQWALKAGAAGNPTAFQTLNLKGIESLEELQSTFQNFWDNSDGIFLEIYEELLWKVAKNNGVMDELSGKTLSDWIEAMHQRRLDDWKDVAGDPFPMSFSHTFDDVEEGAKINYVNPTKCGDYGDYYGTVQIQ
jgi:hypothetical protein